MNPQVTLDNCADEPIHIPGSIQPHGTLLALREPQLEVVVAGKNAGELLGVEGPVVGQKLSALLEASSVEHIRQSLDSDPRVLNPLPLRLIDGSELHGILHRSDGLLVLETEKPGRDETIFRTAYRSLIQRFDRLRLADHLDSLYDIAVQEVAALTGFDRIMIYRFNERKDGQVIAERRSGDQVESFLGLHYPASDIPKQARLLYVENPVRIIPDASYEPVPLEPTVLSELRRPLDLSHSTLRSVSPIHCRYLQNMNVRASMSISLLNGDDLWGLVACHHMEVRHVSYGVRLILEFFARLLSERIVALQRIEQAERTNEAYGVQNELIDQMVSASSFQEGLKGDQRQLTDLIECDGAAILYRGEVTLIDSELDERTIRKLGAAVHAAAPGEVFCTDCILKDLGDHLEWKFPNASCGVVAVPISADGLDFLFWFRAEWIRSVRWAGNPTKAVSTDSYQRLIPRSSFEAWVEEVQDCSKPWQDWEVAIASDFRTALVASVIHQAAELERLNARLMLANEEKDRFLAAVSHELRNPLNAIVGWVEVLLRDPERRRLDHALATIRSNAQAQSELIEDLLDLGRISSGKFSIDTELVNFSAVVEDAVESLRPSAESQSISIDLWISRDGTEIIGDAHRLRQVVWNLLSNAIKFSDPGQQVEIRLDKTRSDLRLTVRDRGLGIAEHGLETIFAPFAQGDTKRQRAGLGLGLSIVKSIVELHKGTVTVQSDGLGLGSSFHVRLPVAALSSPEVGLEDVSTADLSGLEILVAEDQEDAAEMLKSLLEGQGAKVQTASDGAVALGMLKERHGVDLVVSDLDMPNLDGFGLIKALRSDAELSELPVIALTAFGRREDRARAIKAGFRQHVPKPVDPDELLAVIESVVGRI